MKKLICLAHRGASGHEPENTLLAIEKALQLGADWIEVDVYAVENELVVIHDDRLERTTNGRGFVAQQSLAYLRSLDAGKGERIPFLREVFELVCHRAGINVEIKGANTPALLVSLIDDSVRNHGWSHDQILVSSFDHDELMKVKALQPMIKLGALLADNPLQWKKIAERIGAYSLHVSLSFVNEQFVNDAHQRGLKVFVFTVNTASLVQRMRALGVDGVFSDYPAISLIITDNN